DLVKRKPAHVGNVERQFHLFLYLAFDLFIDHLAVVLILTFGKRADNAIAVFSGHRKERNEHFARETNVQRIVRKFPIDARVSDVEQTLESVAFKRQPESVPDHALRTVATDQILSLDRLRLA